MTSQSIAFFDAETKDPTLKKYSSGAVLAYHYPEIDFKVLGVGIIDAGNVQSYFSLNNDISLASEVSNLSFIKRELERQSVWAGHNIAYDLACLKFLDRDWYASTIKDKLIVDTMLLLKMHDQQLVEKSRNQRVYGLEGACKHYKLLDRKESDILHDYAWNSGMYQRWYSESSELLKSGKARQCHKRPKTGILEKFCKSNMHLFPTEIVGDYCLQDCNATKSLYTYLIKFFQGEHEQRNIGKLSEIIKICIDMKFRGIRVDLGECENLSKLWDDIAIDAEQNVKACLGFPQGLNINSGEQMGLALEQDGYKIPRTEAGNYSIVAAWLDEQNEPVFEQLKRYRKAKKAQKDYIKKLINYQDIIPEKYKKPGIGWLYPTFKPLGATLTGRFSSGGGTGSLELNVLAISGRDPEFGKPVRKLFLPYEGETIVCGDFSAQEPRLVLEYAEKLGCPGTEEMIKEWNEDPNMKFHKKTAAMSGLDYDTAKMVGLGVLYNMKAPGLSSRLKISLLAAKNLIGTYYAKVPFIEPLQELCAHNLKRLGYIRTIGGRKLFIDMPYYYNGKMRTQESKGLSKLIQGSALDQTWDAMIECHKQGLKLLLCVHDELVVSSSRPDLDQPKLKDIMENSIDLCVPSVSEVGIGANWGAAKL